MAWTFNRIEPVSAQIVNQLRHEILNGKYRANEQFPPVRQLAEEASVNPNTMQKALAKLEEEGLLYSRGTIGRFVTSDLSVLEDARVAMRRKAVNRWLREAGELGMTREEMIHYLKEEERK